MNNNLQYYWLNKLEIPVYNESGINHVLWSDIEKILTDKQKELFDKYFGVQTCLLTKDGKSGMYLSDVEAVLVRIFENKLTSTQKYWD